MPKNLVINQYSDMDFPDYVYRAYPKWVHPLNDEGKPQLPIHHSENGIDSMVKSVEALPDGKRKAVPHQSILVHNAQEEAEAKSKLGYPQEAKPQSEPRPARQQASAQA